MRNGPRVSIVIGFFNGEKFIRESVESVFAQTYNNWELLLVDDGSTDASTEIALQYAHTYPGKVCYLEHSGHQNRGVCASRNLGIRYAKGEYIALLDVDDVWLSYKLERQVEILNSYPDAGMVYGATQYWYSWTGNHEDIKRDYVPDLGVRGDMLFEPPMLLTLLYPLGQATAPCPSDLLMRRKMIERTGGFEENFRGMYQLYEDQAFLAKVYLRETVFVSSECWDRYRIHPHSCVSVVNEKGNYHAVRLFFLNWLEAYLTEQKITDFRVWLALHKSLQSYGRSVPTDRIQKLDTREIKWHLRVVGGNVANLVLPPNNPEMMRIDIEKAGTIPSFDIQLNMPHLKAKSGHRYSINFRARADNPRNIIVGFSRAREPWDNLGLYRDIELNAAYQNFDIEFVATADDDNARIHFDVGESDISVELSSVSLRSLEDGQSLEPDFSATQPGELERDKVSLGETFGNLFQRSERRLLDSKLSKLLRQKR